MKFRASIAVIIFVVLPISFARAQAPEIPPDTSPEKSIQDSIQKPGQESESPAGDAKPEAEAKALPGTPIVLRGTELFRLSGAEELLSLEERAHLVQQRLEKIDPLEFTPEALAITHERKYSDIFYANALLVRITEADAQPFSVTQKAIAEDAFHAIEMFLLEDRKRLERPPVEQVDVVSITDFVLEYIQSRQLGSVIRNTGITLLLVAVLSVTFLVITRFFNFLYNRLENLEGNFARSLRFRNIELIGAETLRAGFVSTLRIVHLIVSLLVVLGFTNYILNLFPEAKDLPVKAYIRGAVYTILITILAFSVYRLLNRGFNWIKTNVRQWRGRLLRDLKFQNITLLSAEQSIEFFESALAILRILVNLILAYVYLAAVFGLFQATQEWAGLLFIYIATPLKGAFAALVDYLPDLFFLVVVVLVTRSIIRATGLFFREAERGRITMSGFYPEWARPTHRLLSVLLVVFAAIIAFPYLPGANSQAFQGISLFLGFMISLGSSAIIANIVAGIVVTYMRPFKVGDRVKIADTVGDVVEKTLLVTRIRTVKNVDITIPNALALSSHIINYSSSARDPGLILHTTVTIGYDVPNQKVHDLLIAAARSIPDIREEPAPFVLNTSLDDYYVSYELNAYTEHASRMAKIYSDIHQKIQESFHAAGVEIMSPHFYALRDGSAVNIPAEHLSADYQPPPFRVRTDTEAHDRSKPGDS
ncbi:MAG: mechanosensitive ion channel family protein [bacterium]|nr:mechanosensitive ion channel family protein [bacterium]